MMHGQKNTKSFKQIFPAAATSARLTSNFEAKNSRNLYLH